MFYLGNYCSLERGFHAPGVAPSIKQQKYQINGIYPLPKPLIFYWNERFWIAFYIDCES